MSVGRKRVWAKTGELGLVLPAPFERDPDAPRGQVVTADSNRRWATDLTTVWTKCDGLVAVVLVVDCGVIQVAGVGGHPGARRTSAAARVRLYRLGARRPGASDRSRAAVHGRRLRRDVLDVALDHTLAPVGRPTGNAVAERVIETLKVELVWTRDFETIDELREAVAAWMHKYNHARPYQARNWKTPAEERAAELGGRMATAA